MHGEQSEHRFPTLTCPPLHLHLFPSINQYIYTTLHYIYISKLTSNYNVTTTYSFIIRGDRRSIGVVVASSVWRLRMGMCWRRRRWAPASSGLGWGSSTPTATAGSPSMTCTGRYVVCMHGLHGGRRGEPWSRPTSTETDSSILRREAIAMATTTTTTRRWTGWSRMPTNISTWRSLNMTPLRAAN